MGFESNEHHQLETRSLGGKTEATSDEELAAYEDRRNGIGAHFVPMVMQAKQHQKEQKTHRSSADVEEDPSKDIFK